MPYLYKLLRDRAVTSAMAKPQTFDNQQSPKRLIGYARVSTDEQVHDAQLDELRAAGCDRIHQEHGSGASRARPVLTRLLAELSAGDVLIVVRLDRLARSVSHLLSVIEDLEARGVYFRSIRDPIDTSTPQGMFSLQVLGAVAQLERALIAERTKAGIKAAKARGKLPGNPGLRERRPEAIKAISQHGRSSISMNSLHRRRRGCRWCVNSGRSTVGTMSCGFSIAVATTGPSNAFVALFIAWYAKSSRRRTPCSIPSPGSRRLSDEAGGGQLPLPIPTCRCATLPRNWTRWENGLCAAARTGNRPRCGSCWTKPTDLASFAVEGMVHPTPDGRESFLVAIRLHSRQVRPLGICSARTASRYRSAVSAQRLHPRRGAGFLRLLAPSPGTC